jgi:hypothetical protein
MPYAPDLVMYFIIYANLAIWGVLMMLITLEEQGYPVPFYDYIIYYFFAIYYTHGAIFIHQQVHPVLNLPSLVLLILSFYIILIICKEKEEKKPF